MLTLDKIEKKYTLNTYWLLANDVFKGEIKKLKGDSLEDKETAWYRTMTLLYTLGIESDNTNPKSAINALIWAAYYDAFNKFEEAQDNLRA